MIFRPFNGNAKRHENCDSPIESQLSDAEQLGFSILAHTHMSRLLQVGRFRGWVNHNSCAAGAEVCSHERSHEAQCLGSIRTNRCRVMEGVGISENAGTPKFAVLPAGKMYRLAVCGVYSHFR